MSPLDTHRSDPPPLLGAAGNFGDILLQLVTGGAALGAAVLVGLIAYKIVQGEHHAVSTFGLGFLTHLGWDPVFNPYEAGPFSSARSSRRSARSRSRPRSRSESRSF